MLRLVRVQVYDKSIQCVQCIKSSSESKVNQIEQMIHRNETSHLEINSIM